MVHNGYSEYSGWTNYETWNVKLWMDNDQAEHESWHDRATELLAEHGSKTAVPILAEQLEEHHGHMAGYWLEGKLPCCYSDLLLASLREVNWREIAERVLEDVHVEA